MQVFKGGQINRAVEIIVVVADYEGFVLQRITISFFQPHIACVNRSYDFFRYIHVEEYLVLKPVMGYFQFETVG